VAAPRPVKNPAPAPAARGWFDVRAPYLVPFVLGLLARVDFARRLPYAAEDAYITFRYAEHWAQGLGPVYNAGERVMGFSSPLWTAWLALGALLHVPTLDFARMSGIAFDLAALVLGVRLLEREAGRASAWAFAVFFAVFPLFSAHAVLGMETSLLVFLLAAAATAVRARLPATGALAAALALTRPEGVVAALAILLLADRRAWILCGVLVAIGWGGLALYFGSPIPQSVTAKAVTYGVGGRPPALDWIEGFFPAFLAQRWQNLLEAQHLFAISVLTLPALVLGLRKLVRERRAAAAIAVSGLAVLTVYVLLGVPYFSWYFVLPLFGWAIAVATGLPLVIRSRLVWAALTVYVLSDAPYLSILYVGRNQVEARLFRGAAERLKAASNGQGTVLLEPIGHIGYVSKLRVIDEVGLVSPEVPRRRRQGPGWYTDIVRAHRPEFLVVRPGLIDKNQALAGIAAPFRTLAERDSLLADYALVGPPPKAADELVVLRRKS
jgi:hypothetical protein